MKPLLAIVAVLLAGCVAFEHLPPDAALGCDSALQGSWSWQDARLHGNDGITIQPQCRLHRAALKTSDAYSMESVDVEFETFSLHERHYMVLDPAAAEALVDITAGAFSGFVSPNSRVLCRYEMDGRELRFYVAQNIRFQTGVGTGRIPGRKSDTAFVDVAVPAKDMGNFLRDHPEYFDGKPLVLERMKHAGANE